MATIDLTNKTARKVLFAALLSMVHDNHSAQDNLSKKEWEEAFRLYDLVTEGYING